MDWLSPSGGREDLQGWRAWILETMLRAGALLGLLAYVPSLWLSVREQLWVVAVGDTVVYVFILVLALRPGLGYRFRAGALCTLAYLLAVMLFPTTGERGAALHWLAAYPVTVSLLLGLRAAIKALGLSVLTVAVIALVLAAGYRFMPMDLAQNGYAAWLISASNALFLSAMLSLGLGTLLRGLEAVHRRLQGEVERHRQTASELKQAQKLEMLGTLAGGMAHDLSNALQPALLVGDRLQLRDLDERSRRDVELMIASAERSMVMAQRLLRYGRRSEVVREPILLGPFLEEVGRFLKPVLKAGSQLELRLPEDEFWTFADSVELHQILLNLGTNAAHAMKGQPGLLTIALTAAEEDLRIEVADTGVGMDEATLARACEAFFTTRESGQGTGLGLSMVKRLLEDLGGRLELQSEVGVGTRATVVLKRHRVGVTCSGE